MSARALIAGVSGAVGGALSRELARRDDWVVTGLSRRPPVSTVPGVDYLQADMASPRELEAVFAGHEISHLFYCARATHAEQVIEDAKSNTALLENLLDAAESASAALTHVHLVQGGKVYGVHIGPFKVPAREDDPRCVIENFNYDQEDLLRTRSAGAGWTWSASRPNTLLHYSPHIARNLVSTLGAYAALCRVSGAALDFPGPEGAYTSITQVTSIEILARAIAWMGQDPACANQAFNVTNGDVFRWCDLWPRLARAFDVPCGVVRPMRLADVLAEKGSQWAELATHHGLAQPAIEAVANWGFADATLERYWDEILCHNKLRRFGFNDWADSEALFFELIARYQGAEILPSLAAAQS